MNTTRSWLLTFLLCGTLSFLPAQSDDTQDRANAMARKGVQLMDAGQLDSALVYLERAQALFPDNAFYAYEIGLTHYMKTDYATAEKSFKHLLKQSEPKALYYQMLGNTYDLMGKRSKAIKTYQKGLEVFPDAGQLYLELGVVAMTEKDFNLAAVYWEKGISVEAEYPSNYYWATKLFAATDEKVWALLYGELFLNLEFDTPRSEEIARLLFDVYQQIYESTSDTSGTFHLTQRGFTISLDQLDLKEIEAGPGNFRLLPFEGEFATKFAVTSVIYARNKELNLAKLDEIRRLFLQAWFEGDPSSASRYPNALLNYQKIMLDRGDFTFYTYYLFRAAHEAEFEAHYSMNRAEFKAFLDWFRQYAIDFEGVEYGRLDY